MESTSYSEGRRQANKRYYWRNRVRLRTKQYTRHLAYKESVVNVYTNGVGLCQTPDCGQGDLDVLCVDHVDNNGAQQRKVQRRTGNSFYLWLRMHDYPHGYQILCANCNLKKEVERQRGR